MTFNQQVFTKAKFFGYVGFIASVLTIFDMLYKYLFISEETSFSLTKNSALEFFIIIFLMLLSIFFLSKDKKNTNFLIMAGYLYSFISFLIYIITAYQYIIGNNDIQHFSLEIFLIFVTSFVSAVLIFRKLQNNELFNKYAYLFVLGLFIVIIMLFWKMSITNDSQMEVYQIIVYMLGGTGLFSLLFFFGKNTTHEKSGYTKPKEIPDNHIDDDARW